MTTRRDSRTYTQSPVHIVDVHVLDAAVFDAADVDAVLGFAVGVVGSAASRIGVSAVDFEVANDDVTPAAKTQMGARPQRPPGA